MSDYNLPGELEAAGRRSIVVPLPTLAPLPYELARRIAETTMRFRIARVGPRVVAALLRELDHRDDQVTGLMDQLIQSGDSLLAVAQARKAAEAQLATMTSLYDAATAENQRLRDRLAARDTSGTG